VGPEIVRPQEFKNRCLCEGGRAQFEAQANLEQLVLQVQGKSAPAAPHSWSDDFREASKVDDTPVLPGHLKITFRRLSFKTEVPVRIVLENEKALPAGQFQNGGLPCVGSRASGRVLEIDDRVEEFCFCTRHPFLKLFRNRPLLVYRDRENPCPLPLEGQQRLRVGGAFSQNQVPRFDERLGQKVQGSLRSIRQDQA